MTWLIAQTLNKSPILQQASPSCTPPPHPPPSLLPANVGGQCGWEGLRFGSSIVRLVAGVGVAHKLGMMLKMAGIDTLGTLTFGSSSQGLSLAFKAPWGVQH